MTCLIALDAAGSPASVALRNDEQTSRRTLPEGAEQARRILPAIADLLAEAVVSPARVDAIAVGIGPGAFTGVRLAIATAQGLALAWARPIIPVSSLAALAADAIEVAEGRPILAVLDARMGEVYAGWFVGDGGVPRQLGVLQVVAPEALRRPRPYPHYVAIGSGMIAFAETISSALGAPAQVIDSAAPRADQVARLAAMAGLSAAVALERVEPAYVRNKVAWTTAEQRVRRRAVIAS